MAQPKKKVVSVVCTECDLPWEDHKTATSDDKPTLEDCVRLLKKELQKPRHQPIRMIPCGSGGTTTTLGGAVNG